MDNTSNHADIYAFKNILYLNIGLSTFNSIYFSWTCKIITVFDKIPKHKSPMTTSRALTYIMPWLSLFVHMQIISLIIIPQFMFSVCKNIRFASCDCTWQMTIYSVLLHYVHKFCLHLPLTFSSLLIKYLFHECFAYLVSLLNSLKQTLL